MRDWQSGQVPVGRGPSREEAAGPKATQREEQNKDRAEAAARGEDPSTVTHHEKSRLGSRQRTGGGGLKKVRSGDLHSQQELQAFRRGKADSSDEDDPLGDDSRPVEGGEMQQTAVAPAAASARPQSGLEPTAEGENSSPPTAAERRQFQDELKRAFKKTHGPSGPRVRRDNLSSGPQTNPNKRTLIPSSHRGMPGKKGG